MMFKKIANSYKKYFFAYISFNISFAEKFSNVLLAVNPFVILAREIKY